MGSSFHVIKVFFFSKTPFTPKITNLSERMKHLKIVNQNRIYLHDAQEYGNMLLLRQQYKEVKSSHLGDKPIQMSVFVVKYQVRLYPIFVVLLMYNLD